MPTICRYLTARHRASGPRKRSVASQASWGSTWNRATARSARHKWPMKTCMGAQRPRRPRRTRAPSTKPLLRATATKTVESRASSAWASSGSRASSGSSSLPLPGGVGWERGWGTAGEGWGERPELGSVLCGGTEPRELPAGQAEPVAWAAEHRLSPPNRMWWGGKGSPSPSEHIGPCAPLPALAARRRG